MKSEMRVENLSQQRALNYTAFISTATRQNWRRLGLLDENKGAANQAKFNANKLKSKLTTGEQKAISKNYHPHRILLQL